MNTGIIPVITLTNNIVASGTLKFNLGSWIDVDTYQEIYDVADVNEEVIDVDVTIDSAQDLAGNSQISYNEVDAIDVDTIAPVVSINSLLTNDQSPELTGTIDDISAIIQITVDGNNYIAANNGDGTWTLLDNTIFPLLADGTYEIIISTTDLAGNVGNDVTTNELEIDTTPPTLLNIQTTNIGTSSATITWTTNENANSSVYYWTTLPASLTGSATFETAHSISLSSLSASTLYYYNVTGCDAAGNCITSTQYNFTTSDIGNGNGESGGSSGGGGGGGGSSSAKYYTCSKWNEWSACNNNQQTRICLEKIITTSQKGIIESKFNATEIQPCTASALIPLSNPAGEKSRSNEISPIEKTPGFFGRITGAITGAATGLTKSKGGKISLIVIGVLALAWLLLALGRRMNREDIGRKIKIIHKSDLVKKI